MLLFTPYSLQWSRLPVICSKVDTRRALLRDRLSVESMAGSWPSFRKNESVYGLAKLHSGLAASLAMIFPPLLSPPYPECYPVQHSNLVLGGFTHSKLQSDHSFDRYFFIDYSVTMDKPSSLAVAFVDGKAKTVRGNTKKMAGECEPEEDLGTIPNEALFSILVAKSSIFDRGISAITMLENGVENGIVVVFERLDSKECLTNSQWKQRLLDKLEIPFNILERPVSREKGLPNEWIA